MCIAQHWKRQKVQEGEEVVEAVWAMDSEDSNEEGNGDDDVVLDGGESGRVFYFHLRTRFREKLAGVVLPGNIQPLPKDLGSPKHGKLKAMQWVSLWKYVIPLIILNLFVSDVNNIEKLVNRYNLLQNTAFLVRCTNLITSWPLKKSIGRNFEKTYFKYGKTSQSVFKNVNILPKHHYALHVRKQMDLWGPMGGVAEFWGERLVGMLQQLKTNDKFGKSSLD
ncbi:hypothetical protein O181_105095 [Austropuccinia psidii MF-1]|uniref:Uncharacterized protein n=1 Tax=Austropuccinia psidii MF-1 TaxID=1389203 RepID=A0A9Q3JL24_9BASI|nr:hypothetical protein [Austropuccinia psidii MF-1]